MPKRSRKEPILVKPRPKRGTSKVHQPEPDANQSAFDVLQELIKRTEGTGEKNPLAVALGRLGGLKGGRARADKLSKSQLSASARKAAQARWRRQKA